ncbi:sensor histidine kinase, partial [Akkermansia muciniphila]|uniref:sensor histidine kinase n=1 Tax=Akkermansia muciniphila TaxID=239935 RepID=UPI00122F3669
VDIVGFGIPSVLLTFLLAVFCRRLYQKLRGLGWKGYARLWVIPLFFVVLYTLQVNLLPIEGHSVAAYSIKILLLLCAFLTYSQMVSAISNAAKAAREAETHAQLAPQLDLQRARMADLESHAEEMKRIRHDRRQHLQVLRGLLEKSEVAKALTYLDDYEGSMAEAIQPPLCENYVADTLCRRYEALAKQSGIQVEVALVLPKEPGVAGSDLAVILGNLWENAVAAALDAAQGHRFVHLRVRTEKGRLLIRMENGFSGVVYDEGGRFLSTKPGRNRADGEGIASIRAVAARYGGMADFTYTPDTFTASVLLYTKNSPLG